MRATQGALVVASTLQIVLGFSGLWRIVARFLSPLSAIPLAALAGFGLYGFGFPGYLAHVVKRGKNIFERFAVIFSVAIVWLFMPIYSPWVGPTMVKHQQHKVVVVPTVLD